MPSANTPATIYGLCDPLTGELKYIGSTVQSLYTRVRGHIAESVNYYSNEEKSAWINGLVVRGLEPEIFEIEATVVSSQVEAERFWIQYYRGLGCPLTNMKGFYRPKLTPKGYRA